MNNNLSQIKNVVYLMLENRSLDNVLGWLYSDDKPANIIAKKGDDVLYHGLEEKKYYNSYKGDSTQHPVKKGTNLKDSPDNDPHESFIYVTNQLFNKGTDYVPGKKEKPAMDGFLQDFTTAGKWYFDIPFKNDPIGQGPEALQILNTYTKEELPVLYGLAKNFAVSDMWFSSVPTQTNCNRAFSICGNSLGYTDNDEGDKFDTPTMFNILSENGFSSQFDWMVFHLTNDLYSSFSYTRNTFTQIPDEHFAPYSAFLNALENNMLPRYSYLEPAWFKGPFGNGNSYHPPGEVGPGEIFVKEVYDKLVNSDSWNDILFIITFDEHGGTYDHYPPPFQVTPPGDLPNTAKPHQHNFDFTRYGVRVPTLLISPWVEPKTVFRSKGTFEYDHTSFIATILNWFGVTDKSKWASLGKRVQKAQPFDDAVNRTSPRTDKPTIKTGPISENLKSADKLPVSDLQKLMLADVIRHINSKSYSGEEAREIANGILANSHTLLYLQGALRDLSEESKFSFLDTYSIYIEDDNYIIKGRVINAESNNPVHLAQVTAWDSDMISKDDNLGSTFTDSEGIFTIAFNKSDFGELFFDRKPDIYFHVHYKDQLVLNTDNAVIKNAGISKDKIVLKI